MRDAGPWLNEFVALATDTMTMLNSPSELACHVYYNEDAGDGGEWEIALFAEPETLGGRLQKYPLQPAASVDVVQLMTVFDTLSSCRWQSESVALDDELGPHLSVEGDYQGHRIWLRMLNRAPRSLSSSPIATSAGGDFLSDN